MLVDLLLIAIGIWLVCIAIMSAIRSFVVPRAMPDRLSRVVAVVWRRIFDVRLRFARSYVEKDRIMAFFAPVALVTLPIVWLAIVVLGFAFIYTGTSDRSFTDTILLSGSSVTTLGFASTESPIERLIVFLEAGIGLIMVALLISYLPTMYAAFSAREAAVTLLDVRASSPPSPFELLLRANRNGKLHYLDEFWEGWEAWFAQVEENHTSLPFLVFYRSTVPEYSWVTASGVVLDAAALYLSVIDVPQSPPAAYMIRAGYLALRRIAGFFGVTYEEFPTYEHPISITREEFDEACAELEAGGIELVEDRDQAWRDFCGWRVNYDTVLLALCNITMAPYAPWSSDRAQRVQQFRNLPIFYQKRS